MTLFWEAKCFEVTAPHRAGRACHLILGNIGRAWGLLGKPATLLGADTLLWDRRRAWIGHLCGNRQGPRIALYIQGLDVCGSSGGISSRVSRGVSSRCSDPGVFDQLPLASLFDHPWKRIL